MRRIFLHLAGAALLLASSQAGGASTPQPGVTNTPFNRKFVPSIKPRMTYEQVVSAAGAPGSILAEDRKSFPPIIVYRWRGAKQSALTVRIRNGRVLDAIILAPNGKTFSLKGDGTVAESP